jgi:tetratricopeptide (TPR) repeat protein
MKRRVSASRRLFGAIASATALTLSILVSPTLAQDPFRAANQHPIGEKTEAAFKAIFEQGDYLSAERFLQQAEFSEQKEPLAYALKASLAYLVNEDFKALDSYGKKTLETAQQLIITDPLRGNLYAAVGHFLQGAAVMSREGTVRGTPQALSELRQVYEYMDKAEAISATDPELNLVRGYMDLMLAINLPFSNPEQAIARLEKFAGPRYLAYRGLAVAYRDLKEYPKALASVDRAIQSTANNPELYYLKAQILASQGKKQNNQLILQEAVKNFDKAIAKKSQLPSGLVKQIERERRKTNQRLSTAQK